jgi:hypothetical protein
LVTLPTYILEAFGGCLLILLGIIGFLLIKLINRYDEKLEQLEKGFRSACLLICELGTILCRDNNSAECKSLRDSLIDLRHDIIDS